MKLVIPIVLLVIAGLVAMLLAMPPARTGPSREAIARAEVDSIFRAGNAALGAGADVAHIAAGVGRRARLAWVAAELDAPRDGGAARRTRITTLYTRVDDEWRVALRSESTPWEESNSGVAVPGLAAADTSGDDLGRGTKQLVRLFRKLAARPSSAKPAREACAIGPLAGAFAAGDSAVRALLANEERRWGALKVVPGSITARMLRDGAGWVTGIAEAPPPRAGETPRYLRLAAAWRPRGEDSWDLALLHVSVAENGGAPARASSSP